MLLPTVPFCGLNVTRLVIGANPFGGYSHQNKQRSREMIAYYTIDRILETWRRAEAAGINTMITNNETEHVVEAVRQYFTKGVGSLQWIAQLSFRRRFPDMTQAMDEAVDMGAKAVYVHGGITDGLFNGKQEDTLRRWCDHARRRGVLVGVAAHSPEAHLWVDAMNLVDFHVVCFFNCGSLHDGKGDKFKLADLPAAVDCARRIARPCIGYKIMAAGRIDPRMAFEYAFDNLKPADVVNVGMHRGDKDDMVEENAAMVRDILSR